MIQLYIQVFGWLAGWLMTMMMVYGGDLCWCSRALCSDAALGACDGIDQDSLVTHGFKVGTQLDGADVCRLCTCSMLVQEVLMLMLMLLLLLLQKGWKAGGSGLCCTCRRGLAWLALCLIS